mgnify:CR=1 FL=1
MSRTYGNFIDGEWTDSHSGATFEVTNPAAAGEVAAAAAGRGQEVVVAVTRDEVGRVTDALRDGDTEYVVEGS